MSHKHLLTLYAELCGGPPMELATVELTGADGTNANHLVAQALRTVANLLDQDNAFTELVADL